VLLSPVAALYGAIVGRRIRKAKAYRSRLPVICVGNFTAGGSGKTPLALLLAKLVAEEGREPWFLSRGYGGTLQGPIRVDPARHSARDVGDEPLLLARDFPAVISCDRREGAEAIETLAATNAVIIMDDGLQNPALVKDLAIAVVDAPRVFGNERVIPAGPLRAPLTIQGPLVQLIVLMGKRPSADHTIVRRIGALTDAPVISAEARPDGDAARFRGRKVLAFAGIANPDRFFSTLGELGAEIIATRAFKDHHAFTDTEARELLQDADRLGVALVTTEKDFARLSGSSGICAELRKRSETLAIATSIEGEDLEVLRSALRKTISS
jgi:tetraacyldisaccharide 4'-kinase